MENVLFDILQKNISGDTINALGSLINLNDQNQTTNATQTGINILLSALTDNASDSSGLSALSGALDRDHDGSILDDLMGYVTGSNNFQNKSMVNGAGILSHVLGDNIGSVINLMTKKNGIDQSQAMSLLTTLAPIVLAALGKSKRQNNVSQSGILDLLKGASPTPQSHNPTNGILGSILDRDGDGDYKDDIASLGMNFLGNLLKK